MTPDGWRPRGKFVYGNGTATAILDYSDYSMSRYQLDIRFTDLDKATEVRDLIMAGKIWPDVCYEDKQVPAPCRHLKDLFREAIGIMRREFTRQLHCERRNAQ